MKKISLFLLASFIGPILFAQNTSFGLKGGLNVAHLESSQGNLNGSKLGLHAGFLAHIHVSPILAVQPEIVYSAQGAKYTSDDGEHSLSLNYINIPVLLQYMFSNGFRLQTGPQLGFLAGVNDKREGRDTRFFTSDDFKAVDFSWAFGLGYVGASGLGIDGRYNFGISNINDFGSATLHNSVFQVGLFYQFSPSVGRR